MGKCTSCECATRKKNSQGNPDVHYLIFNAVNGDSD